MSNTPGQSRAPQPAYLLCPPITAYTSIEMRYICRVINNSKLFSVILVTVAWPLCWKFYNGRSLRVIDACVTAVICGDGRPARQAALRQRASERQAPLNANAFTNTHTLLVCSCLVCRPIIAHNSYLQKNCHCFSFSSVSLRHFPYRRLRWRTDYRIISIGAIQWRHLAIWKGGTQGSISCALFQKSV